ncbi:hypothetical protein V2J09_021748 [Rumex salicifolius]
MGVRERKRETKLPETRGAGRKRIRRFLVPISPVTLVSRRWALLGVIKKNNSIIHATFHDNNALVNLLAIYAPTPTRRA